MSHIVAAAEHGMHVVIMAALHSKCGHYIFALRFHFYLFFLAYSQPSKTGCLPYFHTWCSLSANLGCRSETCLRYRDGADNTIEENSSVFSLSECSSCLQCFDAVCWMAGRESAWKKYGEDGGGGHWLVRMEWQPAGW